MATRSTKNMRLWRARKYPAREEVRSCEHCTKPFVVLLGSGSGKGTNSNQRFCEHSCRRKAGRVRNNPTRYPGYAKKSTCDRCGFVAEDPCQLDVDHINGDHQDNTPGNHQTLCANCHRLKTVINGDGIYG